MLMLQPIRLQIDECNCEENGNIFFPVHLCDHYVTF
jgi:hypothetical protein